MPILLATSTEKLLIALNDMLVKEEKRKKKHTSMHTNKQTVRQRKRKGGKTYGTRLKINEAVWIIEDST